MCLCCCKKIVVKSKTKKVAKGKITFEIDSDFDARIMIVEMDGFLPVQCRLWKKMDKKESLEYFRKNPAQVSLENFGCLDTVF